MVTVLLVAAVCLLIGLTARYLTGYEIRRHRHLPKASTYIPPSNCRAIDKREAKP